MTLCDKKASVTWCIQYICDEYNEKQIVPMHIHYSTETRCDCYSVLTYIKVCTSDWALFNFIWSFHYALYYDILAVVYWYRFALFSKYIYTFYMLFASFFIPLFTHILYICIIFACVSFLCLLSSNVFSYIFFFFLAHLVKCTLKESKRKAIIVQITHPHWGRHFDVSVLTIKKNTRLISLQFYKKKNRWEEI